MVEENSSASVSVNRSKRSDETPRVLGTNGNVTHLGSAFRVYILVRHTWTITMTGCLERQNGLGRLFRIRAAQPLGTQSHLCSVSTFQTSLCSSFLAYSKHSLNNKSTKILRVILCSLELCCHDHVDRVLEGQTTVVVEADMFLVAID